MPKPPRRHAALADTPRGVFNPDAVGRVPGYPATQEAYDIQLARLRDNAKRARESGRANRRGVPNGWKGRRAEAEAALEAAEAAGWDASAVLNRNSMYPEERIEEDRMAEIRVDPTSTTTDAEWAAAAMAMLFGVILSPTIATSHRLRASRILMPYLRPAKRGETRDTLAEGLAFLGGLLKG